MLIRSSEKLRVALIDVCLWLTVFLMKTCFNLSIGRVKISLSYKREHGHETNSTRLFSILKFVFFSLSVPQRHVSSLWR